MWKWIGGCMVVAAAIIAGGIWFGYRKIQTFANTKDPTARVTFAATPQRVFASLANGDSLGTWMGTGGSLSVARHGPLQAGDVIEVSTRAGTRRQTTRWTVREVRPGALFALDMADSTGRTIFSQRDSLVPNGDSTTVIATFAMPMMSGRLANDTGRRGGGALDVAMKLLAASMSMATELQLKVLKTHIESGPR